MRQLLLFFAFLLFVTSAPAQKTEGLAADLQKRIVYFKDKTGTPYTVQQPLQYLSQKAVDRRARQNIAVVPRDLPVNPAYVAAIKQLQDVTVWYTSKWFNAAVVQCSDAQLAEINALPFVKTSNSLNRIAVGEGTGTKPAIETVAQQAIMDEPLTESSYGASFTQANLLGAVEMHNNGFSGQGMTIAVFDTGFPSVNTIAGFAHLYQNNRIKGTFDFVTKQVNAYVSGGHGTSVLSTMAAYLPGKLIGTAYNANYILLRTEDVASEHKIEEINWLLAAEYADSAGADVINSSLGYNTFDAPDPSYNYNNMDGNTALVTKAADYAAATGMLVVVSAGNSGTSTIWPYVAAPADADSVLTVGSVDRSGNKSAFSSIGPTADGRRKPDVMAVGDPATAFNTGGTATNATGTSFAGPIIAGFAASLWQGNPTKNSQEIIQMIKQSGTLAAAPTNEMGYGIPNYNRLVTTLPAFSKQEVYITNPVTTADILVSLSEQWVKQETTLQVFDITGRLVYQEVLPAQQFRHQLRLQPQTLKQGVYMCRLSSGANRSTLRFLKL